MIRISYDPVSPRADASRDASLGDLYALHAVGDQARRHSGDQRRRQMAASPAILAMRRRLVCNRSPSVRDPARFLRALLGPLHWIAPHAGLFRHLCVARHRPWCGSIASENSDHAAIPTQRTIVEASSTRDFAGLVSRRQHTRRNIASGGQSKIWSIWALPIDGNARATDVACDVPCAQRTPAPG